MATDYNKLKVAELKVELKRLGLPQNGLKADLVARLEAAATDAPMIETEAALPAEGDEDQAQDTEDSADTVTQEMSTEQSAETANAPREDSLHDAPTADAPIPSESSPEDAAAPVENTTFGLTMPTAATDFAMPDPRPQNSMPHSLSASPVRPAEIIQDTQKRKRRSASPAPRTEDIAAKRARLNSEEPQVDPAVSETDNNENSQAPNTLQNISSDIVMGDAQTEHKPKQQSNTDGAEESMADDAPFLGHQTSDQADHVSVDDSKPQSNLDNDTFISGTVVDVHAEEELERDVEPSVHPATSALYIKNFMRPLRPQAVKDHLLDLATPAGLDIDDQTIPDFYLDNIRTHSFVLFNSVTAAKRVRNALHNRVWPDETNRKPLWIDYINPSHYHDWVDMEQSAGRGNRYEVVYDHDRDGNVTANLEESGAAPPAIKSAPQLERRQSIPTGPSRGLTGIEGAPTGPRGFASGGRAQSHASRSERVGDYKSTSTHPSVAWQPVPEELVRRRLDTIKQAKSTDYDQQSDKSKEYRRYFFENGDLLVDRGPEIFLGIRPPHRERERRHEHDRDDRRRGGRGRRNGRRGMPMPHGVPRGGDRYRGTAGSGDYDERPRYDDRGGARYRGESYGRH